MLDLVSKLSSDGKTECTYDYCVGAKLQCEIDEEISYIKDQLEKLGYKVSAKKSGWKPEFHCQEYFGAPVKITATYDFNISW